MQVGFKALADRYRVSLAQPLRVESVRWRHFRGHSCNATLAPIDLENL